MTFWATGKKLSTRTSTAPLTEAMDSRKGYPGNLLSSRERDDEAINPFSPPSEGRRQVNWEWYRTVSRVLQRPFDALWRYKQPPSVDLLHSKTERRVLAL